MSISKHNIQPGTHVILTDDAGTEHDTVTRSHPWQCGASWLIKVDGITGGYDLDRIRIDLRVGMDNQRSEAEYEKAKKIMEDLEINGLCIDGELYRAELLDAIKYPLLYIRINNGDHNQEFTHITEDEAVQVIKHLSAVFGLSAPPKFENVSCSRCGKDFGPGNSGFSDCESHKGIKSHD